MSRQELVRKNAIVDDFESMEKQAAKAVSELSKTASLIKILIPFMHDNILNNKGDIVEADRLLTRDALVPLFPQLMQIMTELQEVFDIHNDDPAVWAANLANYLADYPNCINEAASRYPEIKY